MTILFYFIVHQQHLNFCNDSQFRHHFNYHDQFIFSQLINLHHNFPFQLLTLTHPHQHRPMMMMGDCEHYYNQSIKLIWKYFLLVLVLLLFAIAAALAFYCCWLQPRLLVTFCCRCTTRDKSFESTRLIVYIGFCKYTVRMYGHVPVHVLIFWQILRVRTNERTYVRNNDRLCWNIDNFTY